VISGRGTRSPICHQNVTFRLPIRLTREGILARLEPNFIEGEESI
jgi:hypothetical protein